MEKSQLCDNFVGFHKKLARLKEKTIHLQNEEISRKNGEESEGIKLEEANCSLCNGAETSDLSHVHIQNLCPADRKRIARLVEKLAECTQSKNRAEIDLAEVKAENEAIITRYELFCAKHDAENTKLREKLSEKTSELDKLRLQTSKSLDLLTEQMKAQEEQYGKLSVTIKQLLKEKIRLETALAERDSKIRIMEEDKEVERVL